MSDIRIETGKTQGDDSVVLRLVGIRIEVGKADYQAMLAAIDADLAELHRAAVNRERSALERVKKSHKAVSELRSILYERDGDYFLLRDKPDSVALEAFLDQYAQLMGFE